MPSNSVRGARLSWFLGFVLVANFYLIPFLTNSPRTTDVAGIVLALMMLRRLAHQGIRRSYVLGIFPLLIVHLAWGLVGLAKEDLTTVVQSVRWLLAVPWAWALMEIWDSRQCRDAWFRGLFWGVAFNLLVLLGQSFGLDRLTQMLGLAAQDQRFVSVYGQARHAGMHGHPNAALAVISLAIPAAVGLVFNIGRSRNYIIGALAMLFLGSALTLTRSSLVVGLVTLVYTLLLGTRKRRTWQVAFVACAVAGLVVGTVGPPGGWQRWVDRENIEVNLHRRLETNGEALRLTIEHPLGIGDLQREKLVGATHNALLQAGVVFGMPFAVVVGSALLVGGCVSVRGPIAVSGLLGLFCVHLVGLFMWEEHLHNPTFIILSAWTVLSALTFVMGGKTRRITTGLWNARSGRDKTSY